MQAAAVVPGWSRSGKHEYQNHLAWYSGDLSHRAGGEYAVEHVQLSDVHLGGMKRGNRQAAMVETPASALRDFDGMLGPTSLGITRLAFDFRGKNLYLQIDR